MLWKAQIGEREPHAFVEYFLNIVQNVRMFVVFAVDSMNVIWYNNKKALFPMRSELQRMGSGKNEGNILAHSYCTPLYNF